MATRCPECLRQVAQRQALQQATLELEQQRATHMQAARELAQEQHALQMATRKLEKQMATHQQDARELAQQQQALQRATMELVQQQQAMARSVRKFGAVTSEEREENIRAQRKIAREYGDA